MRDKQYGDWMNIWADLTLPAGQKAGYDVMIGNTPDLKDDNATLASTQLYVPLQFWFCRNPGLALPLIAYIVGRNSNSPATSELCRMENRDATQGAFDIAPTPLLVACC